MDKISKIALLLFSLVWLSCLGEKTETVPMPTASPEAPVSASSAMNDSLTVSLITCYPGPEIYELCGHEAIRIRGAQVDSVWNYGVFSFDQPNFVYRYVKGETDYMVLGYPFRYFLPEYMAQGRKVIEQDLNLTQQEAWRLRKMLQTEALPQNREYRYNYVKDNCATRIVDRLDSAADCRIIYPDTAHYGSYRRQMRHYHRDYPWYQFGIDLALGSGLDSRIDRRAEMFVPIDMAQNVEGAHLTDGRQLVKATRTLNQGVPDATDGPTPWPLRPLTVSIFFSLLLIGVAVYEIYRRKVVRWVYTLFFGILGIAGCLVAFLVFISEHEATSPNILLLWINPLQLLLAILVWWRKTRFIASAMAIYDILVPGCMLLSWPFQAQCANPAFFPLMAATIALGTGFAINLKTKS